MMTCKDCVHFDICIAHIDNSEANRCLSFKDKSRFIELTCKVGDDAYYIPLYNSKPYCGVNVGHIQTIGISRNNISIKIREYQPHNKMFVLGKTVFLTPEEAEKKLKEIEENG